MDYVDILEGSGPLQVDIERLENLLEAVIDRVQAQLARKPDCTDIVLVYILAPEAARLDVTKFRKLLRKELDVDTCAAVNFRRKLVSKNCCVHEGTPFHQ
jgi:hypothetical protein